MIINPYTFCKFNSQLSNEELEQYPFKHGEHVLFLSEITNMPGHCAVATKDGKIHIGYHIDDFVELSNDEM